jgi:hypothetical protein
MEEGAGDGYEVGGGRGEWWRVGGGRGERQPLRNDGGETLTWRLHRQGQGAGEIGRGRAVRSIFSWEPQIIYGKAVSP